MTSYKSDVTLEEDMSKICAGCGQQFDHELARHGNIPYCSSSCLTKLDYFGIIKHESELFPLAGMTQ